MVTHLSSKNTSSTSSAVESFVSTCRQHGWSVTVRCDGEKSFEAMSEQLSVPISIVGPGRHVPTVERKIRLVKERVRAIISTCPFKFSGFLLKWAVYFVVSRLNMVKDESGHASIDDSRSPREIFFGTKADYSKDLRVVNRERLVPRNSEWNSRTFPLCS
jgi:hypothetical protein